MGELSADTTAEIANGRILVARDAGVGRITFNKPERMNAMSLDMWQGMHTALDALADDAAIRVLVLTGAGGHAFVSGADISEFDEVRATEEGVRHYNAISGAADRALAAFPKPTLAAIRGYCIGGGLGLAIGCDIRICTEDSRFAIPAARLGLGYGLEPTRRLVRLVGPASAAEILYTGAQFGADAARAMGLVNRVVPPGELDAVVDDMAAGIARNAPLTLAAAKAAIDAAARPGDSEAEARVAAMVGACYASEDYAEGRRAFAEKRPPVFIGR